jgi:CRISPR-associated protein Cas1
LGTAVVWGYGFRARIEKGHLELSDGLGAERRMVRLHRATSALKHLCILAHSGTVTIDALRWLSNSRVSIALLDADSHVTFTVSPPGTDVPRLRRAQVWAAEDETGLAVMRTLLERKVRGQAAVVRLHLGNEDVAAYLDAAADTMSGMDQLDDLRTLEGHSAGRYWRCWEGVRVGFARRDLPNVPDHWRSAGPRLRAGGKPQNAISPAHALLNLAYALLESQTTIALVAVGADAGLALMHGDIANRASFGLDVMEPLRPRVDELILELLAQRSFAKSDFWQRQGGDIRLMAPLARELCGYLIPILRSWAEPLVEEVAGVILRGYQPGARTRTPLSHANRRSVWRQKRKGTDTDSGGITSPTVVPNGTIVTAQPTPPRSKAPKACAECGRPITPDATGYYRKYCSDACAASAAAAHSAAATEKRNRANLRRKAERDDWERAHPELDVTAERARFRAEMSPRLASVPIPKIMAATGLSLDYSARIRRGEKVPHPRFFPELERLIEESSRDRGANHLGVSNFSPRKGMNR